MEKLEKIVYVKAGPHAGEPLSGILERKKGELTKTAKFMFWGYGTSTTKPDEVMQYVAENNTKGLKTYLVMRETTSNPQTNKQEGEITTVLAAQYSVDGIKWEDIPAGIEVTYDKNVEGDDTSKHYAFVCGTMEINDIEIDLADYAVAKAKDKKLIGKVLAEHLYELDKGIPYKRKRTQSVSAEYSESADDAVHIKETICCVCELDSKMPAVYVR